MLKYWLSVETDQPKDNLKNVEKCTTCKGKGSVVKMFQMGPGMYQQVQQNCDKCNGQG